MSEFPKQCGTSLQLAKELGLDELSEVVTRLRAVGWDDDEIVQHRDYRAVMDRVWGK